MKINSNYAYIPRFKGRVDEALIQRLYWHRDNCLKNISDSKEIEIINRNMSIFIDNLKDAMKAHHNDTILEFEEDKIHGVDNCYFTHILLQNPEFKLKHFIGHFPYTNLQKTLQNLRFCKFIKDENVDAWWIFGMITCVLEEMRNTIGFREIVNNTKQYLEDIYESGKLRADMYIELKSKLDKTISELQSK